MKPRTLLLLLLVVVVLLLAAGRFAVLDVARLRRALPRLPLARALRLAGHVNRMLAEAGATTPQRAAMMLAQVAHESGTFAFAREIDPPVHRYEGRADLGNTRPGDGARYAGRGWLQLTGRANYREAGRALGLPLEERPELAEEPEHAARIAAWYWRKHNLNALADRGDTEGVTRRINGGTNGLDDRRARYAVALAALAPPKPPAVA